MNIMNVSPANMLSPLQRKGGYSVFVTKLHLMKLLLEIWEV